MSRQFTVTTDVRLINDADCCIIAPLSAPRDEKGRFTSGGPSKATCNVKSIAIQLTVDLDVNAPISFSDEVIESALFELLVDERGLDFRAADSAAEAVDCVLDRGSLDCEFDEIGISAKRVDHDE